MKLKFKLQGFQTDAVNAVCALFDGQQRETSTFSMEQSGGQMELFANLGVANTLLVNDGKIIENMREVQRKNVLPQTFDLQGRQFSVEMETGTGKTYVYTKTIYELNHLYGFTKFIIVVPSVAIREGVYKSLQVTQEHFSALYDNASCRYFIYNSAQVYVDDVDNVTKVQKELADMGFQVQSQIDWLESSKQQSDMVQAVLGGIGAVSLFVAAIGIANTMMMSIYERTKEIGVMKVLGCDMGNIRNMFLIESGFIGFMGGIVGILLSYGISVVINRFVNLEEMNGLTGNLSRIPPWLSVAAVVFAIFVGMAAGFMPAMRAMKLSPLAAIRNE